MAADQRFWAMGTVAHVIVEGGTDDDGRRLVAEARALLDDLETRWSRFRPDSELSAINDRSGPTVAAGPDTIDLVDRAVHAWWATAGRFDPTVLPAMRAIGYDRSFETIAATRAPRGPQPPIVPPVVPGCADITVDRAAGTVTLPPGVELDLGGIGKGAAADRVVTELGPLAPGGLLVNLGGDLRVTPRRDDPAWTVALADPRDPERDLAWVRLSHGAMATSTTATRRWQAAQGPVHHLIDPATGRSATSGIAQVTVFAAATWWAEVLAKAALVAGVTDGVELIERHGAAALIVTDDGDCVGAGEVEELLA